MFSIATRELRSLFLSPLAWVILAVIQAILAYVFLIQVEVFLQWQPRLVGFPGAPGLTAIVAAPVFHTAAIVFMLVTPFLTMRLLSEERRSGTLALLLSAPVSVSSIVLGKFLGVMAFLGCALGLVALLPLCLLFGGSLDFELLAAGFLGLVLLVSAFSAAGLFMSSLTAQPTIAAVSTFGLLLLLWLLDWGSGTGSQGAGVLFSYLSLLTHFESLLQGIFDTRDVLYYLIFTALFLLLGIWRLDSERLAP